MNTAATYALWTAYFLSLFFAVFWLLTLMTEPPKLKKVRLRILPKVSIIIPAYNESDRIAETLRHVVRLKYPKEKVEVIVVDDGSADSTAAKVREAQQRWGESSIQLISQPNRGKGSALNRGLQRASGEYFVCLDADSLVSRNALREILPYFSQEDIAAVLPALKVEGKGGNLLQKMQQYEYVVNMFYKQIMARLDCVNVTPGPFSVYRKAVLEKLGGFDENGNLTEDLEMALRLQKHHYKIVQILDTQVKTLAPKTFKALYRQRNRWYKGSVLNALRYHKMIFNRSYGDFGMMQMPTKLISGAVTITVVLSMIYYGLKPLLVNAYNLRLVDFDIWTYIKSWTLNMHILDLDYSILFVGMVMAAVSVYVLRKSHRTLKEKIFNKGMVPFISYVLMYFIILGIVWMGIALDLLMGRRQKW